MQTIYRETVPPTDSKGGADVDVMNSQMCPTVPSVQIQ